ncbi:MAG: basic amino acid ABC transporter substrate-binding protein [Eubacterium sp.]|nr:basic amino acid ABC transporter substrate-binding protein [Eubacterium sp.]
MKLVKKMAALGLAAVMALSMAACGSKQEESSSDEQTTTSGGTTIVFGTNAEFPPFEYVGGEGVVDGFDGIDMAIAKKIAEDNGKTASINNMEFDSLLLALQNGQIDAVIAGMTITDERKEAVDFSEPYYTATQVMIVKDDSDIKKASDMQDKKIAVVQGYTGEECVKGLGYSYEAFKKGSETILELMNGKCDVVVIDSATAEKYVGDNEGIKIVDDPEAFEAEEYGIAVKKGNTELLNQINASISKMKSDGTISSISAQYLDADTSSDDASATEAE